MTVNSLTDLTMGGDITVGANNITMTGNLASGANPITHGWFTDLTVTNAIAGSITGNAATVTTNANLTGPITSSGNATSIASQTGTGTKFVMDTSPTLVTPNIGAATGTSLNLSGLTASTALATDGSKNLVSVTNTGSGNNVLATSPTLTTPSASQINAPSTAGVGIAGRSDGSSVATGNIGEIVSNPTWASGDNASSSVTITIASPAVITYTAHGLSTGAGVNFTTTGSLPTGITVGTNYYIIKIDANSFNIATSVANAFAGTKVNTSGSQSGTHTCQIHVILSSAVYCDANGLQLTAGIWAINASPSVTGTGGALITGYAGQITTTSGTSLPFGNTSFAIYGGLSLAANGGAVFPTGTRLLNLSSTTVVYGIVRSTWSTGACKGACSLVAVRVG